MVTLPHRTWYCVPAKYRLDQTALAFRLDQPSQSAHATARSASRSTAKPSLGLPTSMSTSMHVSSGLQVFGASMLGAKLLVAGPRGPPWAHKENITESYIVGKARKA